MRDINEGPLRDDPMKLPPKPVHSKEFWRGVEACIELLKLSNFDRKEVENMLDAAHRALGMKE